MASEKIVKFVEEIKTLTVLELADLVKAKKAKIIGNGAKLEEIIACLDNFDLWVNIVTPN